MARFSANVCRSGLAAALLAAACASPAAAVNVVVNYDYDSNNFFLPGSQARAAIEAAASFYSGMLTDTLAAVATPPDFVGGSGGKVHWTSTTAFDHPSIPMMSVTIPDIVLAADEYRIFVGAQDLEDSTLGVGGPGGKPGWSRVPSGPGFTSAEVSQINQIHNSFVNALRERGETSGFASWGGAITFDRVGTNWHFNHLTAPAAGTNDFFSVALHEMAHALGFGLSNEWDNFASGAYFAGPTAIAKYGGAPPLSPPNPQGKRGHWASGTMSKVFGTNTPQEAAMDPDLTVGTRKRFTSLDAAALVDIGWSLSEPMAPTYNAADFNQDGIVNGLDLGVWRTAFRTTTAGDADGDNDTDGRDFLIWQRNVGKTSVAATGAGVPEPGGGMLAACGTACLAWRRRTARRLGRSPT